MFDDIVTLVWPIDEKTEDKTDVFARIESIGRTEFFAGAETGLKPESVFITRTQKTAIFA